MSNISCTQTELTILETFSAIQGIPIPEEICMEWLFPDMKTEVARAFLHSLTDKGALQFDGNQAEYTIQQAWTQPVCSQERLKENLSGVLCMYIERTIGKDRICYWLSKTAIGGRRPEV